MNINPIISWRKRWECIKALRTRGAGGADAGVDVGGGYGGAGNDRATRIVDRPGNAGSDVGEKSATRQQREYDNQKTQKPAGSQSLHSIPLFTELSTFQFAARRNLQNEAIRDAAEGTQRKKEWFCSNRLFHLTAYNTTPALFVKRFCGNPRTQSILGVASNDQMSRWPPVMPKLLCLNGYHNARHRRDADVYVGSILEVADLNSVRVLCYIGVSRRSAHVSLCALRSDPGRQCARNQPFAARN
jgi:hypothetical protein